MTVRTGRFRRARVAVEGFRENNRAARVRLAPVNLDSSTDRYPDRSSTDDGSGATDATDTHLGIRNNGSAGSPRDNKVSGQTGRCKRGSLHLL